MEGEMIEKEKIRKEPEEKSFVKDISFCGVANGANASVVDVKNGRVLRVRPLHYDWKYKPEEFNPWKIKARGQVFEQGKGKIWDTRNTVPVGPAW